MAAAIVAGLNMLKSARASFGPIPEHDVIRLNIVYSSRVRNPKSCGPFSWFHVNWINNSIDCVAINCAGIGTATAKPILFDSMVIILSEWSLIIPRKKEIIDISIFSNVFKI